MKAILFTALVFLSSSLLQASSIQRISFDKLESISQYIVTGIVKSVKPYKEVLDQVEITPTSNLKGNLKPGSFTLTLQVRGGLKEFDPQLKVGDIAIFYLKEENSKISLAYSGAIALFPKQHFDYAPKNN